MSNQNTAYPLCWPPGWPKTDVLRRESPKFKTTLAAGLANMKRQIELLGGKNVVLSSNYTLGLENPKDSGVVAFFDFDGKPTAIPCDRWKRIEDNVHAIGLTVAAMRGMERWGAKQMIKAMFSGFKLLPNSAPKRDWRVVLGMEGIVPGMETLQEKYRSLARLRHPDAGGSAEAMTELNLAYEQAKKELA